jgi:hypothetical protein
MTEPIPEEELVPDEEALAYEAEAVASVCAGLAAALAPVLAAALASYAAGTTGRALAGVILAALGRVSWPAMTPQLQEVAVGAVELGVDRARRGLDPLARRGTRGLRGPVLEVPDLDAATRVRIGQAEDLTRGLALDTKRDLDAVLGKVSLVRSRAEGQVRWTATEGINAGTSAVAERVGQRLIWVAERDACLHCLAYAGWVVEPGDTFPVGLTFGDQSDLGGVPYAPLHPGCRCQVRLTEEEPGAPPPGRSTPTMAARLAAEARRSVVYGWTEHASRAATIRAMSRLLDQGAGLPASVERRARELVRTGMTQDPPK